MQRAPSSLASTIALWRMLNYASNRSGSKQLPVAAIFPNKRAVESFRIRVGINARAVLTPLGNVQLLNQLLTPVYQVTKQEK